MRKLPKGKRVKKVWPPDTTPPPQNRPRPKVKRLKKAAPPDPPPLPPPQNHLQHLPQDIILLNILPKLPSKHLLSLKTVYKSWNSTISDPKFAQIHLRHFSDQNPFFLWKPRLMSHKFCFLKFENQKFESESVVEFPVERFSSATPLSSCDGLILLKDIINQKDDKYVLWNPTTRTYTEFSSPHPVRVFASAHGICYDPFNIDYKVVYINRTFYSAFSLKNGSWTEKKEISLAAIPSARGIIVNGTLHWLAQEENRACDPNTKRVKEMELSQNQCGECKVVHYANYPIYESDYNRTRHIIYYNARCDKLEKLPKPECFEDTVVFCLIDLKGKLCLYRNTYDVTKVEMWMMKEYGDRSSWMKFMTIENVPTPSSCPLHVRCCYRVKPLCLTSSDDEIVLDLNGSKFMVYSSEKNTFGDIKVYYGDPITPDYIGVNYKPLVCVESLLVLPSRINEPNRMEH